MTIARQISEYAVNFSYDNLSPEVVHAAKRALLDTLGCTIGGYDSDASRIFQSVTREMGTSQDSTIIGSGLKTDCLNASLANGIMARYLDYMDEISIPVGSWYVYCHPSEVIPSILALAERQHCSGRETLMAIALGYQLSAKFCEASTIVPMSKKGWSPDTAGAYFMPAVLGKLLSISVDQMENAIGIAGSHGLVLGILDTTTEANSMTKNLRFPYVARDSLLAVLLAQKGFTGPTSVLEGEDGFIRAAMDGDFDVKRLTNFDDRFWILDTEVKAWACCGTIQGHLNATLNVVKENHIQPEDIARIRIQAGTRSVEHTGNPIKRYPQNKETADHSAYYVTAIAILEGDLVPGQYSPAKYADPRVKDLSDKVSLEVNPELDKLGRAGITEITTKQGRKYSCRVDYPKGHPRNPMSDEELQHKFRTLTIKAMGEKRTQQLIDTIYGVEKMRDTGQLMKMLVF